MLQRTLAAHSEVSTASEPWILLPFVYAQREQGVLAEYGHKSCARAIEDFVHSIDGKDEVYWKALREFALKLYTNASSPEAKYFLDKTPRYTLIANELVRIFPDAKFIVLFRNPLSVAASIVETWGKGDWNLGSRSVDIYNSYELLDEFYSKHSDRCLKVNYESLVGRPQEEAARIFSYLGLKPVEATESAFKRVDLKGRMGDPTGVHEYAELSQDSIAKWERVLNNRFRRRWALDYLDWLGEERLKRNGYDLRTLRVAVEQLPMTSQNLLSDVLSEASRSLKVWHGPLLLRERLRVLFSNKQWRLPRYY